MFLLAQHFIVLLCLSVPVISKLGNYSQIIANYSQCGLSRRSLAATDMCFQFAHESNMARLSNGRDATEGETPWTVLIITIVVDAHGNELEHSKCTGSIIDAKWVITSAHCLHYVKYRIYPSMVYKQGVFYNSSRAFNHSEFTGDERYDIGLINLREPIVFHKVDEYYVVNKICLPDKQTMFALNSTALISGWGQNASRLHIGYLHLMRYSASDPTLILTTRGNGGVSGCKGDSGAPVWQYSSVDIHAVLTGVFRGKASGAQVVGECSDIGTASYVRRAIDWIMATLSNNL